MPNAFLLVAPPLAPLLAAVVVAVFGWTRATAVTGVLASAALAVNGGLLAARVGSGHVSLGHVLRADSLAAVMVIVVGAVATMALWASIGYLDGEISIGHTDAARSRQYGVLCNLFVAAMALAVLANNLGVMWVAIEATTVMTAFLVGHRRTKRSLEATWKYVIICSVGISLAFLGTVLLYFASLHAGPHANALDIDSLTFRATALDPGVTRLAAVLLLLGYGTKVGLAPFHSWLADAHSEAPAPVSALMSGVLLAVAFSALLRLKAVLDAALGPAFLRGGLLTLGLLTLLIAASMLVVQRDYKRMLAYSSLEQMGIIAIAAAAGTKLAIAALLLHVLAHGLGKSVLFIGAGHLQLSHHSTAISDVSGVVSRSRLLGGCLAGGFVALVGFPPFALFASEIAIARGAADAHLAWALGLAALLVVVASAALLRHGAAMLLGAAPSGAPSLSIRPATAAPMLAGLVACAIIGVSAAPLTHILNLAGAMLALNPSPRTTCRQTTSRRRLPPFSPTDIGSHWLPHMTTARSFASSTCSRTAPESATNSRCAHPRRIRKSRHWRPCRFQRAGSNARCTTCSELCRSVTLYRDGSYATHTGQPVGTRCVVTPGPRRTSLTPTMSPTRS